MLLSTLIASKLFRPPIQARYAGHNKWSKIRHAKGANDMARGKLFSKITRQITAGIQAMNGETDTFLNHYLAAALHAARAAQMPKQTINEAIHRATQKKELADKVVRYEGLGPGGIAVIIEALVSKPTKTNAEIKLIFKKSMGSMGPVEYLFKRRGYILFKPGKTGFDLEKMVEVAIEVDAEDIGTEDDQEQSLQIFCQTDQVYQMQNKLAEKGFEIVEWGNGFIPNEQVEVSQTDSERFSSFLEQLESQDEVVHVYHNAK